VSHSIVNIRSRLFAIASSHAITPCLWHSEDAVA
jgi:hypothetical protein